MSIPTPQKSAEMVLISSSFVPLRYADTICDLGFAHELANYGEYSGAPTDEQTFNYARTILGLMTRTKRPEGKVLIVGGGIANFTDVAATFRGLVKALRMYRDELLAGGVKIYVRRAGPNYQEGLKTMLKLRDESGLFLRVFGPEQDAVSVCPLALGLVDDKSMPDFDPDARPGVVVDESAKTPATPPPPPGGPPRPTSPARTFSANSLSDLAGLSLEGAAMASTQFTAKTRCLVYGLQPRAVQGMLDFDFMCKRSKPSVAAMVYPFQGQHYAKFYWGTEETLVPVYPSLQAACAKHPDASVLVNFASRAGRAEMALQEDATRSPTLQRLSKTVFVSPWPRGVAATRPRTIQVAAAAPPRPVRGLSRSRPRRRRDPSTDYGLSSSSVRARRYRSVFDTCSEALDNHADQLRTLAIIAEGVPERQTRAIIEKAEAKGVGLIGPATVGGIKPGCFRIGNTGGMLDNIVMSKLYRPGSVSYARPSGNQVRPGFVVFFRSTWVLTLTCPSRGRCQ